MANFSNQLETDNFVSQTAISKICHEMLEVSQSVHSSALQTLRNQLEILDIPAHKRHTLLESLSKKPFTNLQQEFSSYYHLNKFLEDSPSFKFVEPVELKLGGDKKKYLPVHFNF